jgi:undecaprenyl-diphosphatase
MDRTTPGDLPASQAVLTKGTQGSASKRGATTVHSLWGIMLVGLIVAGVIVHIHPMPWPFDLQTTIMVQSYHPGYLVAWVNTASYVNDPNISTGELIAWLLILSLIGLIAHLRGKQALFWVWAGVCIGFGTAGLDGLDGLFSLVVGRPRPASPLIHVYVPEPFHSFPSGHVENDMVYYGFLLYLSFTAPVRNWRYRRVLIPLQVFFVLVLLTIGYSRIYEGSHWLTDTLGGYLSGAVFLSFLIFVYRWGRGKLIELYHKKAAAQIAAQAGK